jgi:predicted HTH transcriptional regulator
VREARSYWASMRARKPPENVGRERTGGEGGTVFQRSLAGAKKIEREKLVISSLPEHSVRILDHAREHGRVSTGEMVKLTGVSRNTLKEHFRQLVEKGYLSKQGGGRST